MTKSKKAAEPADKPADGDDIQAVKHLNESYKKMTRMLGRVIVGQVRDAIE